MAEVSPRKIYVLHEGQRTPVEIPALFRIMTSPTSEQNACYFFNRAEADHVRWVPYHFAPQAEVDQPGPDLDLRLVVSLLAALDSDSGQEP